MITGKVKWGRQPPSRSQAGLLEESMVEQEDEVAGGEARLTRQPSGKALSDYLKSSESLSEMTWKKVKDLKRYLWLTPAPPHCLLRRPRWWTPELNKRTSKLNCLLKWHSSGWPSHQNQELLCLALKALTMTTSSLYISYSYSYSTTYSFCNQKINLPSCRLLCCCSRRENKRVEDGRFAGDQIFIDFVLPDLFAHQQSYGQ